jgi:hypothetical protein
MGDLKFETAGNKFTAIPKTSRGFHRHQVNDTCNQTNRPACNIIDPFKAHSLVFIKSGANIKLWK